MNGNRPPSSSSSVGGFGPPPPHGGSRPDSGRSQNFKPGMEDALQKHYGVLKGYLASHLHDEKGNMKPNRARDKLLRLSVTQFMELSTDVYDELIRREDERLQRRPEIPRFLLPKQNFHPKRNQARQKLSTLPIERFRQLATDVFWELERRIPRFVGGGIERPDSVASNISRNGMRPPGSGYRGPAPGPGGRPPMGPNGMAPPNAPYQSFRPASPGPQQAATRPPTAGSDSSNMSRPLPKTFQSNTIVPNKSTMVEDDDNDEDEDAFSPGVDKALSERFSKDTNSASGAGSAEDKEKIRSQEMEINELKLQIEKLEGNIIEKEQEVEEKVDELQGQLLEKEEELKSARSSGSDREAGLSQERNEWFDLREELEQKHLDVQRLNESLQQELEQLQQRKSQDEQDSRVQHDRDLKELRVQLNSVHNQTSDLHHQLRTHQAENEELRTQLQRQSQALNTSPAAASSSAEQDRRIELLQEELTTQEKLSNEVREEAMMYLQEMRELSRQNDHAVEQEDKLAARVNAMEKEVDEWRIRYTRVKAMNKHLRASTAGLGLQTSFEVASLARKDGLVSEGGLVRDVDVTRFQLAVDELLKVARGTDSQGMLDGVKSVAVSVQSITSGLGTDGYPTPSPSPSSPRESHDQLREMDSVGRLKMRVMGTANALITATKMHASAEGLSSVALVDAAASHLTAAVVELIKAVGIKPSAKSDLQSDLGDVDEDMSSFYDDRLSPGEERPYEAEQQLTPGQTGEALAVQLSGTEAKPAPLNLSRSKSTKGWFGGWGKKGSVDETSVPAPAHVNGLANSQQQEVEYEAYR